MIALDALEQLDAGAFELIAADARSRRVADRIEIAVEKAVGERAHGQMRGVDMLEQHRAAAHHRHRRMQRMGLAAQRRKLLARAGAVGRLGEPPLAERQRLVGAEHHAVRMLRRHRLGLLARQQRRRPSPASSSPARASTARSSISAGSISTGTPAASSSARRAALFEASTSGSRGKPQRHRAQLVRRLPAALGQQRHHLGGGFLDRAARHVDDRPVVPAAELARRRDLRRHRLAVDILVGVVLGAQAQQPVLADLHDPLRARGQADHQRLRQRFELAAAPARRAPAESSRS